MAGRRVVAHFMHESEAAEVTPQLTDSVVTDGFAIGEIDEAAIPDLERKGIVFQYLDDKAPDPLLPDEVNQPMMASADPSGPGIDFQPSNFSDSYYLTLAGPLVGEWRRQLESLDVNFRVARKGYQWITRIPANKIAAVRQLPFVTDLETREYENNLPTMKEVSTFGTANTTRDMIAFDVLLEDESMLQQFLDWIRPMGVPIADFEGRKVRIHLFEDDPRITEIATRTDLVIDVQPYVPPELHNERARILLGVDGPPNANPAFTFPLQGDGEIVAVADTGVDQNHPDLAGRLAGVIALGRPGDPSDPNGHGTHVAGSVVGDGAASAGEIKGTAPKARLFFQSVMDKNGKLGGIPFRLQTLFDEAHAAGARIHNNSWGSAAMAAYRINSLEVDEYVRNRRDMLIIISAGNEGTAADPLMGARNSALGFVDWLSVGAPATAKNALTVGASRSDRTNGGLAHLTYGSVWPPKFPADPTRADSISGDPESMAAFSSRGPCDDFRIKPDVVAPGTDILSCRSSTAPLHNFWGPHAANGHYAYMGGTSMSAPLVAGCAAIVRQYYTQQRNHSPSAALLKATLINSTRKLRGPSSVADFDTQPNFHQGFGCVYMPNAIPTQLVPGFELEFYDNWENPAEHFTVTGQRKRFRFSLNPGGSLRITMAYTDPPGRALQNNLNLFLQMPDNSKKFGNQDLPHGLNRPDTTNNVEIIRLDVAPGGNYLIQISALNLLQPQDFALVITGDFSAPLTEV